MREAITRLKALRGKIKPNTYRTIKGQIKAGNLEAALVGIGRLEKKINQESRCNHE